ncbi:MAG: glycoside hydrolase family 57 [Candidatus Omnitrophota bacterium]
MEKCYWPILDFVDLFNIPLGIELSGYTLEQINKLSPDWTKKIRSLLKQNKIEIIGSGYSQVIGPLVPAEVNQYNQKIGIETYQKILGVRPIIALVNEQAYSVGLLSHYKKAGYQAIVTEWDNPYRFHQNWNKLWKYYPQIACDDYGNRINLIWNKAIAFQKFQRYAHAEIEFDEYLEYLKSHIAKEERTLALYGNDAEIFDFRPGRFLTEAKIYKNGEWNRIKELFKRLKEDRNFDFILPSDVLKLLKHPLAGNKLHLESSEQPIPVKKQEKYNITRWAVTGKNDTEINTKCYQIYYRLINCKIIVKNQMKLKQLWKKLCYLWSSDFRTHIEQKRWLIFQKELETTLRIANKLPSKEVAKRKTNVCCHKSNYFPKVNVRNVNTKIEIETKRAEITLNRAKGLAIDSLIFKNISAKPLIGTIPHGYYDDISFGADFFTGHTIIEESGKKKITDLEEAHPVIDKNCHKNKEYLTIKALLQTRLGKIQKEIFIYLFKDRIDISYDFDIFLENLASLRTGIITLLPESFDKKTLYYKTMNGGYNPEKFSVGKNSIRHTNSVDRLISACHCLGSTSGWVEMGDKDKHITVHTDKSKMYSVPMIEYENVSKSYFFRCSNSVLESDETSVENKIIKGKITLSITASR